MTDISGTSSSDNIKGTTGDDTLYGGAGDDFLQGRAGGDRIEGGSGNDQMHGDGGDDVLVGGAGNDFIHGGLGIDTAVYSGSVRDYLFVRDGENLYLTHRNGGVDGADRLLLVERLQFADALIDLTQNNAPIASGDSVALGEDGGNYSSGSASVLDNDFDWEGNSLQVAPGTFTGAFGILTINSDGTFTYTRSGSVQGLAAGQSVQDVFTYSVSDGSLSATGTLTFNIAGANDAPTAAADSASGGENQVLIVDVLANDGDVDNGATLTVASASAPAGKGAASIVGNQVRFDPGADFDHLAAGASEVVVVSYTITDEHAAASSSSITITVTGTNDGPVANGDNASGQENATLTVDVLANDSDVDDGSVLTLVSASAPAGKGSVSISSNRLVFDPGGDFDRLAAGATETVNVTYAVQDEHGAASSATLSILVTGTNDGPVAKADVASTGENGGVSIAALANDMDVDDGAVLSLVSASVAPGQGSVAIVGGQLVYDPGTAFDHLSAGQSANVVVSYTMADEHGASSSSTVTVKVNGANDPLTIDVANSQVAGSATELVNGAPGENSHVHQSSGTIAFDDADSGDSHYAGFTPNGGGYLGSFTLGPVDQSGDSVGWNFSVSDAALDALGEGQVVTQVYTIYINEAPGSFVSQDVTITLTGKADNSPPLARDDSYSAIGNVTLNVAAGSGVLANDYDDAGMGSGPGKTPVSAFDSVSANGGKVVMNPDGSFSYMSAPGFTGTDSFTYTVTDADGASDTATVTLSVGPSVWFVDNAAAGSANLGTQTDPFTSIASFNAAQGTASGPAAGETIFVRKGTGTYTEVDGFNLLSGQTLIGGEYSLVVGNQTVEPRTGRPTIVATGAGNHGIELSTDNSIKGLDIGSTGGAGISDGNGTVGNLYVHDVGKQGMGQILDIDQGGTLDVTMNYTQSLGSTGGAIDLHGVGGTFVSRSGVVISGIHSGGGIDITGSSIDFKMQFAGGVFNDHATAFGVRFEGNSGSFASTFGMFDVSTKAGTALLFQNGGTVHFSGIDNNISSFSGSAVVIRDVASAGVTLESVSSNTGSANAIILENAGAGGFTITGEGTNASGGVIGKFAGADGSMTEGTGILIVNTSNVSLANMAINSNVNFGIRGVDVTNFTLKDSVVGQFGNGSSLAHREGSISFTNLNGTALFEGNYIGGGRADNLHIDNSSGSLDLTIRDSATRQAIMGTNNLTGEDNIFLQTSGTASLKLMVDGVEFRGARTDQLHLLAEDNSSHDVTVRNSSFINAHTNSVSGGGGIFLSGGGSGSDIDVDYRIENNVVQGATGHALGIVYAPSAGTIRGHIDGNTIGLADGIAGSQGSSDGGSGIFVALEKQSGAGAATHTVTIEDNRVYDIAFGLGGIELRSNGGDSSNPAVLEAIVRNNIVDELGDGALAALWATVGGAGPGDFARLGLDLSNNQLDAGDADFGLNAIYLDQVSTDARFYFPGYTGDGEGDYSGGNASAGLHSYLAGRGNVMTNGGFAGFAGGVDAGSISGATGDMFVYPVWP